MLDKDDKELLKQLGEKVESARSRAGLTQAQLAKLLGLSRTSVTNIEAGRQPLYAHMLIKLAKATNSPITLFFELNESNENKQASEISDLKIKSKEVKTWVEALMKDTGVKHG